MLEYSIVGLFCEDIRTEKTGQNTIIGIFPDNVNVPNLPLSLPKLCLYTRSNFDPKFKLDFLGFELTQPDGEAISQFNVEKETIEKAFSDSAKKNHPVIGLVSASIAPTFKIEMPGQYKLIAKVNGESFVCAALNVIVTEKQSAG